MCLVVGAGPNLWKLAGRISVSRRDRTDDLKAASKAMGSAVMLRQTVSVWARNCNVHNR